MHATTLIRLGAALLALAVMLGAFGAHGLQNIVSPERLVTWQKANFYHFAHAIGLILLGLIIESGYAKKTVTHSAWLMLLGIIIFSGSLYLLTLTGTTWLGAITPIGGLAFITAWLMLALTLKKR